MSCIGLENAFAGKPAPTRFCVAHKARVNTRSRWELACQRRRPHVRHRPGKRLRRQAGCHRVLRRSQNEGESALFVGAGLPAKTASRHAPAWKTPSPASRLPQGFASLTKRGWIRVICGSWLASEDGLGLP